jgi:hypothetical protein
MVNEQLLNFIRQSKQTGIPDDQIRQQLINGGGWSTQDIQEAFNSLEPQPFTNTANSSVSSKKYFKLVIILVVLSIFVGGYFVSAQFGLVPNFQSIKNTVLNTKSIDNEPSTQGVNLDVNNESQQINTQVDQEPAKENKEQQNDNKGWNTYTSSELGFEIKYPPSAKAGARAIDSELDILTNDASQPGVKFVTKRVGGIYIGPLVFVKADTKEVREKAQNYIDEKAKVSGFQSETIKIDASHSIKTVYSVHKNIPNGVLSFFGLIKGGDYDIFIDGWNNQEKRDLEKTLSKDDLKIMLTTFRFVDTKTTDDLSNWKTYTNTKNSFEIKYPSDWFAKECDGGVFFNYDQSKLCNSFKISIAIAPKSELGNFETELSKAYANIVKTQINVGGISATQYSGNMKKPADQPESYAPLYEAMKAKILLVPKDLNVFEIVTIDSSSAQSKYDPETKYVNVIGIFDKMVSSFKFTK